MGEGAAEAVGEKIREGLEALQEQVDCEELKATAAKVGEEAAAFVRKYPLQSAAGAFALGCVLGALFGRRR